MLGLAELVHTAISLLSQIYGIATEGCFAVTLSPKTDFQLRRQCRKNGVNELCSFNAISQQEMLLRITAREIMLLRSVSKNLEEDPFD